MGEPSRAVYPCPCCGWIVFEEPPGSYDICPVCWWEDDLSQLRFPDLGGANVPLIEAQRLVGQSNWEPRVADPASLGYRLDPNWRPIDPSLDTIEHLEQGRDYGATYPDDRTAYYYWRSGTATDRNGDSTDHEDLGHYPPADASPAEFEQFVIEVFRATEPELDRLEVQLHEKVEGVDGEYDIDGTVRFTWSGLDFLVLVEAKMHKNPIKREFVQVLNQKVQSAGAHKGVMVSTSRFQQGALDFAKVHGIALVEVTEGRFTVISRSAQGAPVMTREEAKQFDIEPLVGHVYGPGEGTDTTTITLVSPGYPDYVCALLLGMPARDQADQ